MIRQQSKYISNVSRNFAMRMAQKESSWQFGKMPKNCKRKNKNTGRIGKWCLCACGVCTMIQLGDICTQKA